MILSWGWYSDSLVPDPGKDRLREDFQKLHNLGFNGVKLCLWFPPSYYFDLADELGLLLWVELPMWIPLPKEGYHSQVRNVRAIGKQATSFSDVYALDCRI
jgi:beta-galactosidase/beta-glucuronidase